MYRPLEAGKDSQDDTHGNKHKKINGFGGERPHLAQTEAQKVINKPGDCVWIIMTLENGWLHNGHRSLSTVTVFPELSIVTSNPRHSSVCRSGKYILYL